MRNRKSFSKIKIMFIKAVFSCLDYFISSPESSWRGVWTLPGGVKPILTFFTGAGGGGSLLRKDASSIHVSRRDPV
jgi:hypothetical protein